MIQARTKIEEQKPVGPVVTDKAVRVHATLHFKRPKSHFKKGVLKTNAPKFVLKRPDIDNCLKFILDVLQPTVMTDDKLVVEAVVKKVWCNEKRDEKTDIELTVMD